VFVDADIASTLQRAPLRCPERVVLRVEGGRVARETHDVDLTVFGAPGPVRPCPHDGGVGAVRVAGTSRSLPGGVRRHDDVPVRLERRPREPPKHEHRPSVDNSRSLQKSSPRRLTMIAPNSPRSRAAALSAICSPK